MRLHECKNCLVCLHCHSRPIIEGCKDIRFTPLQTDYVSIPFVTFEILSYASDVRRPLIHQHPILEICGIKSMTLTG